MENITNVPPILELLPQRPPFVIVDRIADFNETTITTELLIKDNEIFIEDDKLSATGLIENIAQTCATRIGYINWLNNNAINIGYIGAVHDLNIYRRPKLGEKIQTTIESVVEIMNMTLVKAVVKCGDETLVEAEMKIAVSNKPKNNK